VKRALDLLSQYVIRGRTKIAGPYDITSISKPDDFWRVFFDAPPEELATWSSGNYAYIYTETNKGYHEILNPAGPLSTFQFTTGSVDQDRGKLDIYLWNTYNIKSNYENYLAWIQRDLGISPDGATVLELHSGKGKRKLMLDRPDAQSVTVQTNSGTLLPEIKPGGFLLLPHGQTFPRGKDNLEVTLTTEPNVDAEIAAAYLTAADALGGDAEATGGGSLSVISWSRNYGSRGKFSDTRNDFAQKASNILRRYAGKVVGK
jgi:hypothetical protein